jgi:hypothetical protein
VRLLASGLTVAVDNPAAPGRNQRQVDAVALGEERVFLVLRDADPAHPPGEQHADAAPCIAPSTIARRVKV